MQFVRFVTSECAPQWGVLAGEAIHQFGSRPTGQLSLTDLATTNYLQQLQREIARNQFNTLPFESVTPLAPVPRPGKIVASGLNYRDHAEEQDAEIPERPLLFAKAPSSVTNPNDPIVLPDAIEQVDYEVELAVIMGRTATDVSVSDASKYVAGYTIINDVSARDAQFTDKQWFRGKSYNTFGPLGPVVTTGNDFDPHDVAVSLEVNGETMQSSSTSQLIFDVNELISYISQIMTLDPGDVIATGTPGGVGVFRDPPRLLEPGDQVTARITGIGALENPVIAE